MSDIFISYASADRERARVLAHALEDQGWSVWWDRNIPPGRTFDEVIEEAIDAARCVIVLWSKDAIASTWVKTEAAEAARRGILVPALLDDVKIPLEFRRIQAAQLVGWHGNSPHPEFDLLTAAVTRVCGDPGQVKEEAQQAARVQTVTTPLQKPAPTPPVPPKRSAVSSQQGPQMSEQVSSAAKQLLAAIKDALTKGSKEQRQRRWTTAGAAALGAWAGALLYGGIFKPWRDSWGWTLLPLILAGAVTFGWAYGVQQSPPRAAKTGGLVGLVGGVLLTAVLAALFSSDVSMARWVSVEGIIWGIYGVFGGAAMDKGWRTRFGPPVATGLVVGVVAGLILVELIYHEFSTFRLMSAAGWLIALLIHPLPEAAKGVVPPTEDRSPAEVSRLA